MRKLIYPFNLTLDGCCQHDKQFVDHEMLNFYTTSLASADTFVYGRKTYELMTPYWPSVLDDPGATQPDISFARAFVSKSKVVFSRTLPASDNGNVRITGGDLRDEILKLKQQSGKDILAGGVDLTSQLLALDLIDEFRFLIGPVIAGRGRRLFDNVPIDRLNLKLINHTVLNSGAVVLHYAKESR